MACCVRHARMRSSRCAQPRYTICCLFTSTFPPRICTCLILQIGSPDSGMENTSVIGVPKRNLKLFRNGNGTLPKRNKRVCVPKRKPKRFPKRN